MCGAWQPKYDLPMRKIRIILYGLVLLALLGWGALWLREGGSTKLGLDGLSVNTGIAVGGPFALVDTGGRTVTEATYRGRWMLVYFGYTFCPDVCPTELQTMANALDALGPDAAKIAPIFITIDPARDTPATLAGYVKLFDDRLIGLTGTDAQIAAVARAYRVYFARAERKDTTQYLMDHSSFLYLMGPDGNLRALYRPGTSVQELSSALRTRLAGG